MMLAMLPVAAFAEGVASNAEEARMMARFDSVWAELDSVEQDAIAIGASAAEVTMAVYKAALVCAGIDANSIKDLDNNGFSFTVSGMAGCYDYKIRNTPYTSALNEETIVRIGEAAKNGPSSMNVLLVGPYYGHDSSFTNQYANEAASLGETLGGEVTTLQSSGATGPAIAEAAMDAGVIIYDSHGAAYSGTSYLCLTSGTGITSEDLSQGWAMNGGSWYGIDGRYIENHVSSPLPNTLYWMAICEGMKLSGRGVTGYALLRAGAGIVYGYSQSVTFSGDYVYERTFWNEMKAGATVADAYNVMTATHGNWDPAYSSSSGAAWPIVMSPVDDFPANPDSHQTVYCDWTLFGGSMDPVALEGYTLSTDSLELYRSFSETVRFQRTPSNANDYELEWVSSDESIATVSGTNFKADITGVGIGETDVICKVYVNGSLYDSTPIHVNVLYYPTLEEALNTEGGHLTFTTATPNYPWLVHIESNNNVCAKSGNGGVSSTTSILQLTLDMHAGETLSFRMKVSSETNYDKLAFIVNGSVYGTELSGNGSWQNITYTAQSDGTYNFQWRYKKDGSVDSYDDCGYVDDIAYSGDTAFEPGDVNNDGNIDANDALIVLRYSLNLVTLTPEELDRADIIANGTVDANDALAILRIALNIA